MAWAEAARGRGAHLRGALPRPDAHPSPALPRPPAPPPAAQASIVGKARAKEKAIARITALRSK